MAGNAIQPDMIPVASRIKFGARWQAQLRTAWRDPPALLRHLGHDPGDFGLASGGTFPFLVTEAFAARMTPGDRDDPLLRQVLPLADEDLEMPGFGPDPVGDPASRAVKGVLHKYRGRALLITTGACPIHCRYCFRREFDYAGGALSSTALAEAVDYIAATPDVEEVILSGGDPLTLGNDKLRRLTDALSVVPHYRCLRIHSRMPVTLPARIDDDFIAWLEKLDRQVVMVVHANHANEFDSTVSGALARIRDAGATILNQAVLLAGVNDTVPALARLMETGFAAGALPYYLHLLDRVTGSAHFEVGRNRAVALMDELREQLPGYLVPRLVEERAGAASKLPVS
ncbi:MAG TPA: EF-P beta-lysylation protein EpmB [Wenzhouxiangellaceae bacterium]|nr:EF-P beta-lysylation protein EpmB [Wenzhouxiangellaceae bacterium]